MGSHVGHLRGLPPLCRCRAHICLRREREDLREEREEREEREKERGGGKRDGEEREGEERRRREIPEFSP